MSEKRRRERHVSLEYNKHPLNTFAFVYDGLKIKVDELSK